MKIVRTAINATHYSQLDINSLIIDTVLPWHIFIKRDNNYVIIIEAGVLLTPHLYHTLKIKNTLYVSKKQRNKKKYIHQNLFQSIQYRKNDFQKSLHLLYEIKT